MKRIENDNKYITSIEGYDLVNPEVAQIRVLDKGYEVDTSSEQEIPWMSQDNYKTVINLLSYLITYLQGFLITDGFSKHRAEINSNEVSRSDWEKLQLDEIKAICAANRIGINSLSKVFTPLAMLESLFDAATCPENFSALLLRIKNVNDLIFVNKNKIKKSLFKIDDVATDLGISREELIQRGFHPDENDMIYLAGNDDSTGYDHLSLKDKLKIVQEATSICKDILKYFGYQVRKR